MSIDGNTKSPDEPRRQRFHLVLLIAITAAAFANSIPGDFVWIDRVEILEGGYRVTSADDFRQLWRLTLDDYLERAEKPAVPHGGYWRPIYALSLSLDWLLWQDRAWCYHVENILWHLAVVVGLYWLGLRLFRRRRFGESVSFWAALIFGVHPLCVHAVTWISGRKDTMCAAFAIASLLALAKSMEATASTEKRTWRPNGWLLVSSVTLLLALGCKELALVVPLVATLLVHPLASKNSVGTRRLPPGATVGLAALWACVVFVLVYRMFVLGGIGLSTPYSTDSFWKNVAMSSTVMWQYVATAFWPVWPSISDTWPIPRTLGVWELLAIVGWLPVIAVMAFGYVRGRSFAYGLLWFTIFMIPAMGIIPLRHFHAERYMYPALWGLSAVFALAMFWFAKLSTTERPNTFVSWGLAALTIVLATITARANLFWRDEQTLFSESVAHHPRHVEARLGLAHRALENEDYQTSVAQSRKAIEHGSDATYRVFWSPWIAHTNLGLALYYQNQLEAARAAFERALKHRPDHARSHYHAGLAAFAAGDLPAAERHNRIALRINPDDFHCRSNLAVTLLHRGDARGCVDLLAPLVRSRPNEPVNLNNYASALLALEEYSLALDHFERLIALEPAQPLHRAKLAWCLWETGRRGEARRQLERVRQEIPDHATVRFLTKLFAGNAP